MPNTTHLFIPNTKPQIPFFIIINLLLLQARRRRKRSTSRNSTRARVKWRIRRVPRLQCSFRTFQCRTRRRARTKRRFQGQRRPIVDQFILSPLEPQPRRQHNLMMHIGGMNPRRSQTPPHQFRIEKSPNKRHLLKIQIAQMGTVHFRVCIVQRTKRGGEGGDRVDGPKKWVDGWVDLVGGGKPIRQKGI